MIEQLKAMPKYETYKDSGVEWLGEIPSKWKIQGLRYVSRLAYGNSLSTVIRKDGDVAVYGSNGQVGTHITPNTKAPVIVVGRKGSFGKINYSEQPVFAIDTTYYIDSSCTPNSLNWLKYALIVLNLDAISKDSAVPGLAREDAYSCKLPVPPLPEQTAIAVFLNRKIAQIDQAVAIKEKQIDLLKERKQILIQNAVIKGINPNAPMRDSGVDWLGQIPAHWDAIRVKHIFRLVVDPSEKNNDHELLSIYTDIGVKPRKELEEKGNKASTTDGYWLVKKGDFIVNKLLAWMGAIGLSEYEGVTSPAYDILRPIKPIEGYFYHYLFRTTACSSELKKHSRGIMEMRLRLYFDKFGVVEVPYPSKEEQTAIVVHIETESAKIDRAISLQQQQIDKLKEYKATLISSAVTGKIRVPELIESAVPELADSLVA